MKFTLDMMRLCVDLLCTYELTLKSNNSSSKLSDLSTRIIKLLLDIRQ